MNMHIERFSIYQALVAPISEYGLRMQRAMKEKN